MREKLNLTYEDGTEGRITPACAGKTTILSQTSARSRDHPRVCGKNVPVPLAEFGMSGSPPRVREKHADFALVLDVRGITPACAGKTSLRIFRMV